MGGEDAVVRDTAYSLRLSGGGSLKVVMWGGCHVLWSGGGGFLGC